MLGVSRVPGLSARLHIFEKFPFSELLGVCAVEEESLASEFYTYRQKINLQGLSPKTIAIFLGLGQVVSCELGCKRMDVHQ